MNVERFYLNQSSEFSEYNFDKFNFHELLSIFDQLVKNNDITKFLLSQYLFDDIDFFTMPKWFANYLEKKYCVTIRDQTTIATYLFGKLHSKCDNCALNNGQQMKWYKCGLLHRDNDKPAVINEHGSISWYQRGLAHRDGDKPAHINKYTYVQVWYQHGIIYRDNNQPAIESLVEKEWYINGEISHKEHQTGRCIWYDFEKTNLTYYTMELLCNGTLVWSKNGFTHRDNDLPAVIFHNGERRWYKNGYLHRDGLKPAIIKVSNEEEYYENGIQYRKTIKLFKNWVSNFFIKN